MKNLLLLSSTLLISTISLAQNVGINASGAAPAASAMLDIVASDKGLLIPRVGLAYTNNPYPITSPATSLLIYNTATSGTGTANAVTPGYYYWTGSAWSRFTGDGWIVGTSATNVNAATSSVGYIGTTTNSHVDVVTNGTVRSRFSNLGEFFIGATSTALAGDLANAVSNATFPWAFNGYSSFNGAGVYGAIQSGTTIFAAVQGEYSGTAVQGAGVRGSYLSTTAGTSFAALNLGVSGTGTSSGSYKFGTYGTGGTSTRSGGVLGYDYGFALGALGYFSSGSADVAVYGFGLAHNNGVAGGRMANGSMAVFSEPNSCIGLAIYGGVMGGWVKGLVYGTNFSGEKYGVYVHGNTITNSKYVQLNKSENSDVRIASYATTALTNELTSKGKISLINGQATINFDSKLSELCDLNSLVITATAMGNCNGVYIDEINENGFTIKEMNSGTHNVAVSFIISGTLKQATEFTEAEILSKQYETNMNGVMHNDNDAETNATPIWYDGQNVRHDAVDENLTGRKAAVEAQQKENEKFVRPK